MHASWSGYAKPKLTISVTNGFETNIESVFVCFVCFAALRPKSTVMVMAGRSVHLTTLFPGQG